MRNREGTDRETERARKRDIQCVRERERRERERERDGRRKRQPKTVDKKEIEWNRLMINRNKMKKTRIQIKFLDKKEYTCCQYLPHSYPIATMPP